MNSRFFIYFDVKENKEIIKYRKLNKEYVLDTNETDLLNEFDIYEEENPYHIIDKEFVANITEFTPAYEAIFINTASDIEDYEMRVQPIGTFLVDFLNINYLSILFLNQHPKHIKAFMTSPILNHIPLINVKVWKQ